MHLTVCAQGGENLKRKVTAAPAASLGNAAANPFARKDKKAKA